MNGGVDGLSTNGRWSAVPVFEAGKYLIAFDGAALLLLELWRRSIKGDDNNGNL